jgi:organic radical activating enzyme
LCNALKQKGFRVHIETSGAYPLKGKFDWICVSPKKFKSPLEEVLIQANELKVIVFNASDYAWAVNHEAKISRECLKYLQPEWGKRDQVKAELVDFVKNNPDWQYSVQTHKYMDIP